MVSKVVVVGGAAMDITGSPQGVFIPRDSNPGTIRSSPCGVGRNVAENLSRLGMDVALLSAIGSDESGGILMEDCRAKGIDIRPSLVLPAPSSRYLCLRDESGNLVGAIADMDILEALLPQALEERRTLLDGADFLVLDANLPAESLAWFARRYGRDFTEARDRKIPFLIVDPVSETKAKRLKGIFNRFDSAKPNLAEARLLAGLGDSSRNPSIICRTLKDKGQCPGELFISLGSEGIYGFSGDEETILPLPQAWDPERTVNRSGSGDALLAALVWSKAKGYDLAMRTRYGMTAALLASTTEKAVLETLTEQSLEEAELELFGRKGL